MRTARALTQFSLPVGFKNVRKWVLKGVEVSVKLETNELKFHPNSGLFYGKPIKMTQRVKHKYIEHRQPRILRVPYKRLFIPRNAFAGFVSLIK